MTTFRKRLLACARKGRLNTADLQHWFDRPYATVRYWLHGNEDFRPGAGPKNNRTEALKRLSLLEWAIEHVEDTSGEKVFPLSPRLISLKRIARVRGLYAESFRLFESYSSTGRVQSRSNQER